MYIIMKNISETTIYSKPHYLWEFIATNRKGDKALIFETSEAAEDYMEDNNIEGRVEILLLSTNS